uniref:ORF_08L n=1 Tax=Human herpesvirus 1 (strain R15) TaxID=36345 RepID=Q6VB62_HHV1R|nr:ORF_08L [Human alphaherpesvirus 1 strain R-15]
MNLEITKITLRAVPSGLQTRKFAHGFRGGVESSLHLPYGVAQVHAPGSAGHLQQAAPRARGQTGSAVSHQVTVAYQVAQAVGTAVGVPGDPQDPKQLIDTLAHVAQVGGPSCAAPPLGLAHRAP